jgi:hypothetical protein
MNVTGGFGTTTWTVQRGQNGSTAAAHVASQTVNWDTTPSGEISWNATTKTLTVLGTIFIDGSAKIANASTNKYIGQATLYLSGTFYLDGKMCGGISSGNCDFAAWDPNTSMLTIVTNSTGGQVPAGDGVQLNNNASYQGSLYSAGAVDYGNNAFSDGPVVGTSIILANNVTTQAFANITTLPVGQPGNPEVYAQPNPPQMFSG